MRHWMMGLTLTAGILASTAGESKAQFSLSIGNPYYGSGIGIGNPGYSYGYGSGYSGFAQPAFPGSYAGYNTYSNSGYVAGPGSFSYSSGYRGYAPAVVGYGAPAVGYGYAPRAYPYGYVNRPVYGYGSYGSGRRYGFQPFRGVNSWLR